MSTEPTTEMMNEVIARFMGGVKQIIPDGGLHGYKEGVVLWMCLFSSNADPVRSLEFHTSWDWVMPVVEKIHSLAVAGDAINGITNETIFTFSIFAPLKDVHRAAYQFITWYNEYQQKQTNAVPKNNAS